MSNPRARRGAGGLLVPLALTATAAAAALGLWLWLGDEEPSHDNRDDYNRQGRPSRRSQMVHDRITELDEETADERTRSLAASSSGPGARFTPPKPGKKKTVAVVVKESSAPSALLHQLPTPFNLESTTVFILVYSRGMQRHPLAEGAREKGEVYEQALRLLPRDYPTEFVMPYTDQASLVPLLKQLGPEAVYVEESLAGSEGVIIGGVMEGGWVGGVVVVAEDSHGAEKLEGGLKRFGKKCRVVDVRSVGEDWMHRVG